MDDGSKRYAKCIYEKIKLENQVVNKNDKLNSDVNYEKEFFQYVLKKCGDQSSNLALKCVRQQMRLLYNTEEYTLSKFRDYFECRDPQYALHFCNMLQNQTDNSVIKWIKASLLPFGRQLLYWCDGGGADIEVNRCNGKYKISFHLFLSYCLHFLQGNFY
jgi:hypothetical protein